MRIVVVGGAGMLGHKLWQLLPRRFDDTWTTIRKKKSDYARFGELFQNDKVLESVDVSNFDSFLNTLSDARPDVVVNCIGLTKRQQESDNTVEAIRLNALFPHVLASWGKSRGCKIIHLSTDCVFDGRTGGYTEQSALTAQDLYGRTKSLGELHGANTLTIRTSFIGRELSRGTELLEWFLQQRGKKVTGYRSALYTGLSTIVAAQVVGDIIEKYLHLVGVYHVSTQVISKFDLLCLFKNAFNLDVEIEPEDSQVYKRDLVSSRFREATGIVLPTWNEMAVGLAKDTTPYAKWKGEYEGSRK